MFTEKSSAAQSFGPIFLADEAAFLSDRLLTDQKQRSRRVN